MAAKKNLTMFSFGYWGNGRAVPALVRAIDAVERDRGYSPPLWVDVRLRRAVRAQGFCGDIFERQMGDRYRWFPDLGNDRVGSGRIGVKIRNPAAARDLLELAVADRNRRVIFFCACEYPCHCHRRVVSKLLTARARKDAVPLTVTEWPGGEPEHFDMSASRTEVARLCRGDLWRIKLPSSMSARAAAAVPWGSTIRLHAQDREGFAVIGPARFGTAGPYLQVFEWSERPNSLRDGARVRREYGAQPLAS